MNSFSKMKDTWKGRRDLMKITLKPKSHSQPDDDSFVMPLANYHLSSDEKRKLLRVKQLYGSGIVNE
ncbi:hypothetical protein ACH5RR_007162 [Cinchona calisaya]|uniref:Uncharacterized protein n=1 Tax=Cinchona calisaya TaxID=153742 RepID=A0ABD3AR16_9GENT